MPAARDGVNAKPYNARMAQHPDVAVIGGGIIGLTAAYFLAKAGITVAVFDRSALGTEASWAGAGILPPGRFEYAATPIDKLRALGSERFPEFSRELRERTGIDNGYRKCGGIEFLQPEDGYVLPLWQAERIPFQSFHDERLEPAIRNASGQAYSLPDYAQVRNPWHLRALIAACESLGVTLHRHQAVRAFRTEPGKITAAVFDDGRDYRASQFLIAAGAWSAAFVPEAHVFPVRGQIVLFNPGRPLLTRIIMVGKRYLVPRGDGRILVGSTEEPEAGFVKANTAEGVEGLTAFAVTLVPALADAPVEKCWSGLRPGTRDGLPFIGRIPQWENAFIAAGHFRAGVQLSIGTGQLIAEMMTGRHTTIDCNAFRLDREVDAECRPAFRS